MTFSLVTWEPASLTALGSTSYEFHHVSLSVVKTFQEKLAHTTLIQFFRKINTTWGREGLLSLKVNVNLFFFFLYLGKTSNIFFKQENLIHNGRAKKIFISFYFIRQWLKACSTETHPLVKRTMHIVVVSRCLTCYQNINMDLENNWLLKILHSNDIFVDMRLRKISLSCSNQENQGWFNHV